MIQFNSTFICIAPIHSSSHLRAPFYIQLITRNSPPAVFESTAQRYNANILQLPALLGALENSVNPSCINLQVKRGTWGQKDLI